MTDTELESLRAWATAMAPVGLTQARQVQDLIMAYELASETAADISERFDRVQALCAELADRCARQSDLLSKRAEKPTLQIPQLPPTSSIVCTGGGGDCFSVSCHWGHCQLRDNAEKQSS